MTGQVHWVRRCGTQFVCEMPSWWDARGKLTTYKDMVIIAHPEHKPMYLDEQNQWQELEVA